MITTILAEVILKDRTTSANNALRINIENTVIVVSLIILVIQRIRKR